MLISVSAPAPRGTRRASEPRFAAGGACSATTSFARACGMLRAIVLAIFLALGGAAKQKAPPKAEAVPPVVDYACGTVEANSQFWESGFVLEAKPTLWQDGGKVFISFAHNKVHVNKVWGAPLIGDMGDYQDVTQVGFVLGEDAASTIGFQGRTDALLTPDEITVLCYAPPPPPPASPLPCFPSGVACMAPPHCCAAPGEGCMRQIGKDFAECRPRPTTPCRDGPEWLCPGWRMD